MNIIRGGAESSQWNKTRLLVTDNSLIKTEDCMFSLQPLLDNPVFAWVILPLLIFAARIFDVTLGTLRIIFVSKGKKFLAPLLGFFEVSIWLLAISQIMQNLDNFVCFIAYAGGFAMGNFIGVIIEEKLALGTLVIRIILPGDDDEMKNRLYESGFGVTSVDAHGMNGNVSLIYTVIKRKDLPTAAAVIESCNSDAFYSIEDLKSVRKGIFPKEPAHASRRLYTKRGK